MLSNKNICEKTTLLAALLLFCAVSAFAKFTTSGTNVYLTNSSHRLGLGTTAPANRLHVAGSKSIARISSSTGMGIGTTGPKSRLEVWEYANDTTAMFYGNTYASGSYLSSDARLKQDARPIQGALDKIKRLKPSAYSFKS